MSNLQNHYKTKVVPKLKEEFQYSNPHQIPKLEKIHINAGLGLNAQNRAFLQKAIEEIRCISGQHPILTTAKNSIAGFKIREGMPLGLTVTLRRGKMYAFLEKFIKLVLPRIRDFRGLSTKHFDREGNYNLGITEQIIFPEIDIDKVNKISGMDISFVTSAQTDKEAKSPLSELGLPFKNS